MRTITLAFVLSAAAFAQHEIAPAEQTYKNITVLKGTPSDQIVPAMQFISASLGVTCDFCHVQGKPEADDKNAKKTARAMIEMQNMINQNAFRGQRQVSCYSCHRGNARPVAVPPVLEADMPMTPPAPPAAPPSGGPPAPTVDQLLEKWTAAAGGADAMHKVTSRVLKGDVIVGANHTPIDVLTKAPNKRVSINHNQNGDSYTAFDGTAGWMGNTGRPAREMSASESAASAIDAEFYLALRVKEMYPQLRRGRPETINGVECEVINGTAPGKPAVRIYLDKKTGLPVRLLRFADTPVGRNPTQIDYADYKSLAGVSIPLKWTLSRPNGRFTIQIHDVKLNEDIDDARFAKPSGDVK
jgi:hypothetical protein